MTDPTPRPSRRPIIGLTMDSEPPGGYSKFPWYALRTNYATAITAAGGLPVALPHEPEALDQILDLIDGLVITGGAFDVDPALFGDSATHETVILKPGRTDFELGITRAAFDRDMPVLGICGGQQLLNVAFGGSLIQHIPDTIADALAHEQPNPRDQAGHDVDIAAGSRLRAIVGADRLPVNSAHHQAVLAPAPGFAVNAVAPDGVIEGIESTDRRFCIGVQWHPEFIISPGDAALFAAFIAACR